MLITFDPNLIAQLIPTADSERSGQKYLQYQFSD